MKYPMRSVFLILGILVLPLSKGGKTKRVNMWSV